jgi:hypothetical protein
MTKYKLGKFVPIIMGLLALLLVLAVPVQAAGETVSIPDATVGSGQIVNLSIYITNVTDLGSATIWLSYDKDVVTVDSVADGDMGTVTAAIFNDDGVTKMTCQKADGMSGDFVFVQVVLRAATTLVDLTSPLDLDVKEFIDTSFNPIVPTVTDGVFTVEAPVAPIIAFSPTSLSFSAIESGANPADKTLEIWNSGAGTLNWGVSDNAGWLSLSPTSDSSTGEHDDVTVSVDIGGMSAGDYSATITIAAAGAINTPQTASVSLHIGSAGPVPPVGGTAHPISKVAIVALWIAVGAAIIVGTSLLVRRRRRAMR